MARYSAPGRRARQQRQFPARRRRTPRRTPSATSDDDYMSASLVCARSVFATTLPHARRAETTRFEPLRRQMAAPQLGPTPGERAVADARGDASGGAPAAVLAATPFAPVVDAASLSSESGAAAAACTALCFESAEAQRRRRRRRRPRRGGRRKRWHAAARRLPMRSRIRCCCCSCAWCAAVCRARLDDWLACASRAAERLGARCRASASWRTVASRAPLCRPAVGP